MVIPVLAKFMFISITIRGQGNPLSVFKNWVEKGKFTLESFVEEVENYNKAEQEKAMYNLKWSLALALIYCSLWIGSMIAMKNVGEILLVLLLALAVLISKQPYLVLLAICVLRSASPFLWLRHVQCDPSKLYFDLTLLIVSTLCCLLNSPVYDYFNTFLLALLTSILVVVCSFSYFLPLKSFFLFLAINEISYIANSPSCMLIILEFDIRQPSNISFSSIYQALQTILPFLWSETLIPSKKECLIISASRITLSAVMLIYVFGNAQCPFSLFLLLCVYYSHE